ncbi:WavE lipopolysaccharide synthesis family protein [Methylobacterium sp. J-092]|uniref:WavE lipopolysaccharide synthesis family protein n=1 Tax=Methylobacterium sp. J-092 TaxID=2836667 RepID=UPI001FB9C69D|nr:WavE lipopolysaccharide synthesis family protein [Methylobacterium sp. J-092]MCJ2006270.1 WavE lipopolysaccharide synthesis family protein [Methylobacterium sp. J-092]
MSYVDHLLRAAAITTTDEGTDEMQSSSIEPDINWDEDGTISIVIQGPIFASNLIEAAVHSQHWRDLFTKSEIIFSISITDCLVRVEPEIKSHSFRLSDEFRDNTQLQIAFKTLDACCNEISLSEGALPLPPIKSFLKRPNNVNLQISAARNGLARANSKFVLRIRSDVVFSSRQFLDQFIQGMSLPRGRAAVLQQRVLISWLYTLNPYTHERLPLHFSDWFHFGLREDVQALWDVPAMTFADSVYYKTHDVPPHSNYEERTIVPRLAVEQHVMYNVFTKHFADLRLNYHNDDTSIVLSNEILIDNFNVCDIISAGLIFEKYDEALRQDLNNIICVNRVDWIAMASSKSEPRDKILQDNLLIYQNGHNVRFPLQLTTNQLSTKTGIKGVGYIATRREDGLAIFGPHIKLPPGQYKAVIHVSLAKGIGWLEFKATLDDGRTVLSNTYIDQPSMTDSQIEIAFDILGKAGERFEILCETRAIDELVITGVTIQERSIDAEIRPCRSFRGGGGGLNTRIDQSVTGLLQTGAKMGVLCFGPYIALERGDYRVTWKLYYNRTFGCSRFDITCNGSKKIIRSNKKFFMSKVATEVTSRFTLKSTTENVEFRVMVDQYADFGIDQVLLEKQ